MGSKLTSIGFFTYAHFTYAHFTICAHTHGIVLVLKHANL